MQEIANSARTFIQAIQNSDIYKEYQSCLYELKENHDLYEEYNEFRKAYYDMIRNNEDNFERMERLQEQHRQMLHDPRVAAFMHAEDRFCQNMRDIYIAIADKLDLDMDFMDL